MTYKKHFRAVKSNRALRALLVSNSLILISLAMLVPVYALFVQQVGGGALSAGLTAGALGITSGISALLSGRLIDKIDADKTRLIMAIGWMLIGISILLYLAVTNVAALLAVQIFAGFVKTISAPAFDTLYARHIDKAAIGQEYGLWEASFFFTAGLGAIVGGIIVSFFGFAGVFISMACLAFIASIYILVLPKGSL